jgi:hypothetical protein
MTATCRTYIVTLVSMITELKGGKVMSITYKRLLMVVFAVTIFSSPILGGWLTRGNTTPDKLPPGKWTFSAGPYFGEGYKSTSVDVYSVTTRADKGLAITRVALRNRSPKAVTAVRLHWYLMDRETRKVFLDGDTALVEVDLQPGENQELSFPVVTFSKVYKPLLNGTNLSGDYRIEIAVVETTYSDTSIGVMGSGEKISYRRVGYARSTPLFGCQGQGCVWAGGQESYICGPNANTYCSVGAGGQSCTETRCESEAG